MSVAGRTSGPPMATIITITLPSSASSAPTSEPSVLREIGDFFRDFIINAFDPYRPELHYMRGPGPACREKRPGKTLD